MASLADRYLITYDFIIDDNFQKNVEKSSQVLFSLSGNIKTTLENTSITVGRGRKISFRPLKKTNKDALQELGIFIPLWANRVVIGDNPTVANKIEDVLSRIHENISNRFLNAGLTFRSGNLANAILSQRPETHKSKKRIFGGLMNISQLDSIASSNKRAAAKRAATQRQRGRASAYDYNTPQGVRKVRGYWAFQDQGFFNVWAQRILPARSFILSPKGNLKADDNKIMGEILTFIDNEAKAFNREARTITQRS